MLKILFVLCGFLLALLPSQALAAWQWPLRGELLERFHLSVDRFAAGQHRGIDIAAAVGTPVRSACAGTVTFTGSVADSGRVVSVRCGDKSATYLHLASITTSRGAGVGAGTQLGTVGLSGRPGPSGQSHLQFDVRRASDRNGYIDPLTLLGEPTRRPPAEPLPAPVRLPVAERQRPRALPDPIRQPTQLPRALPELVPSPIEAPAPGPLVRPGADSVRFPRRVTAPYRAPLALPAIVGGVALLIAIALALTARTLVRRTRVARGSLAASGLLRHDTDLLRQRGAAPRPRLLGDRG